MLSPLSLGRFRLFFCLTGGLCVADVMAMILKLDEVRKELTLAETIPDAVKFAVVVRNLKPVCSCFYPSFSHSCARVYV